MLLVLFVHGEMSLSDYQTYTASSLTIISELNLDVIQRKQ